MQITQISVSTSYTYNLGDYSNIRPEVHLTAQVESGDNHLEVMEKLQKETFVGCLQAIDTALEQNDRPAKFSKAPRWNAYRYRDEKLIAVVSEQAEQTTYYADALFGYRKEPLLEMLHRKYPDYTIRHDEIPNICACWAVQNGCVIFVGKYGKGEINENDFPRYFGIAHTFSVKHRIWERFLTEQQCKAIDDDCVLVNTLEMSIADIEAIPEVKILKEKWEEEMARYQPPRPSDDDDNDDPLDGDLDDEDDDV
jgi:hypothetical protein